MPKLILLSFFFLLAITPSFALIEFRDTTAMPSCDTIIYKRGMIAAVKIISVTNRYLTYKPCDDNINQSFTVKRMFIRDIRSKEFPKESSRYVSNIYKIEAKKTLKTIIKLSLVFVFLILLGLLFSWQFDFVAILLLLAFACLLLLSLAIIHFISLSLKAMSKKPKNLRAL